MSSELYFLKKKQPTSKSDINNKSIVVIFCSVKVMDEAINVKMTGMEIKLLIIWTFVPTTVKFMPRISGLIKQLFWIQKEIHKSIRIGSFIIR